MAVATRDLAVSKVDANTLYEALVLLSYFYAKAEHPEKLPYDEEQIEALEVRLLTTWPELKEAYRP